MGKAAFLSLMLMTVAWPQIGRAQRQDAQRDVWQKPDQVVHALGIGKSEVIADIGAGTGYFARRFAPLAERVYAVDIDPEVLKIATGKAPANLEPVLARADDPKLPDNSIDTVFFCNAFHHIDNREDYLNKLAKALRPGGRVVIIDFFKKPLPVGPPVAMKLSEQEVIEQLKRAGFTKTRGFDFLPYQYFLVFNK